MNALFKSAICAAVFMSTANAGAYSLQDATRTAITQNPEVQAKLHILNSAYEERKMTKGGLWPQLSLSASAGRDESHRVGPDLSANRAGIGLTATQMLFDGFRTHYELKKFSYAEWTRYYELLDTTENIALETARAYYDVQRHRAQVSLAEDNYVQHRAVFEQMQQRVKSGVSRRVDLEQASGRLALASSNLLTERSNLHDVSTRFQRIVGILPPKDLEEITPISSNHPASAIEILDQAHLYNPALKAANANLAAAEASREASKSHRWPTVDLRASTRAGKNEGFIDGRRNDNTIEVVMNYNLFSGGSDSARTRMHNEQRYYAQDLRLKACRDMRQTVLIAYNDVQQLKQQLGFLEEHQLATGKAREAYRQQFNIGQRSLLDLLDTENEYFEARRAATKGQYDLALAYARTQAGAGQLLGKLGLEPLGTKPDHESDPAMDLQCPTEGTANSVDNQAELDARALKMVQNLNPASEKPAATPPATSAAKPCSIINLKGKDGSSPVIIEKQCRIIEIKTDGLFALNSADLRPEGLKQIDDAIKNGGSSYNELGNTPGVQISIIGHTDPSGSASKNLKLSLARAESTKMYLIKQGIMPNQITAEGRGSREAKSGKECLALKNASKAACYAQDRRVELRVLGLGK